MAPGALVEVNLWARRPAVLQGEVTSARPEILLDRVLQVLALLARDTGLSLVRPGERVFTVAAIREFFEGVASALIVPVSNVDVETGKRALPPVAIVQSLARLMIANPLRGTRRQVLATFTAVDVAESEEVAP